jgi:hypothetical protein
MDHSQNPQDRKNNKNGRRPMPKLTKKALDRFLASICEAGGMTDKTSTQSKIPHRKPILCQGACKSAQWRAHLDVPAGVLCVCASWSKNKRVQKHRDVTVSLTYRDDKGRIKFTDFVLCDTEIRWLMETLWHAPIW